jgi:hypothetical protein
MGKNCIWQDPVSEFCIHTFYKVDTKIIRIFNFAFEEYSTQSKILYNIMYVIPFGDFHFILTPFFKSGLGGGTCWSFPSVWEKHLFKCYWTLFTATRRPSKPAEAKNWKIWAQIFNTKSASFQQSWSCRLLQECSTGFCIRILWSVGRFFF